MGSFYQEQLNHPNRQRQWRNMGYRSYGNSQQGYLRTTKWQLGTDWRVFVSRDSWEIRRLGSQHTWWRVSQTRRNVEQTKRNIMASTDWKNDTDWRWQFRSCLCSEQVWFLFCHFLAACLSSIVIFIFIEFCHQGRVIGNSIMAIDSSIQTTNTSCRQKLCLPEKLGMSNKQLS